MQAKSAIMMRVMLNGFHKGSPDSILGSLSEEQSQQIANQQTATTNPLPALSQPLDKMTKIHFSWLLPVLQELPENVRGVLINALPQSQRSRVSAALNVIPSQTSLAEPVRVYLADVLYWKIPGAKEVMPPEFLPQTPITALTEWSTSELEELITFLGLHDLADELRSIVHQQQLLAVNKALSPKEQQYLSHCIRHKGRISTSPVGLEGWSKLRLMLQAKGRTRLAKALSGEHPDVLWTIAHLLEREQGKTLMKEFSPKAVSNVTPILAQQVLEVMNILKKKSKT